MKFRTSGAAFVACVTLASAALPGHQSRSILARCVSFPLPQAAAVEPNSSELNRVRKLARSHAVLAEPNGPVEVFLFAPDEKTETLKDPYCGGDAGAKQYSGSYRLISARHDALISEVPLDPDLYFISGRPHDGLHTLRVAKSGKELLAIYQYRGCSQESVMLFRADGTGALTRVQFVDRSGRNFQSRITGPVGAIPQTSDGELIFCAYFNVIGYELCDAYKDDGRNLIQTESWMTTRLDDPQKDLTARSRALRALDEFLFAVERKDFAAASFYYASPAEPSDNTKQESRGARSAAQLERLCGAPAAERLIPQEFESAGTAAPGRVWLFRVSFMDDAFNDFKRGDQTSFEFRVRRTGDRFRVLDLPPSCREAKTAP